jgi:sugar phosphate isomerase/epimerase
MFKALSPGAVGVQAPTIEGAIAAAKRGGFEGVEFSPAELADRIDKEGVERIAALFADAGIRPAGFGLPIDFRGDDTSWREGLDEFPRLAQAAAAIGCFRCMTWIMPCSNERAMAENRAFHVERLTPAARILNDHGIALGLEFIGPKTLRDSRKYPFIHTMSEMLAMGRDIGTNVGLLLDCYHWYTARHTLADLQSLSPPQVVYVHVNDVPASVAIDDQLDGVRALPGETGVIDIAGFLKTLQAIGYEGPVTPEPFKKELKDLADDGARLKAVGGAMEKIWRLADL